MCYSFFSFFKRFEKNEFLNLKLELNNKLYFRNFCQIKNILEFY